MNWRKVSNGNSGTSVTMGAAVIAFLVVVVFTGCDGAALWSEFQDRTDRVFVDSVSPLYDSVDGRGDLIVVGRFDRVNGAELDNIAWLDGDGELVTEFDVSTDGTVYSAILLERNGELVLVIGGEFTRVTEPNGTDHLRDGLAAVDLHGNVQTWLNVDMSGGTAPDPIVYALAVDRLGNLWVGGDFAGADDGSGISGDYRNLYRLSIAAGAVDSSIDVAPNGIVHDLALGQNLAGSEQLLVVGEFSTVATSTSSPLAVVIAVTETDSGTSWSVEYATDSGFGDVTDPVLYSGAYNFGLVDRVSYVAAGMITNSTTVDHTRLADFRPDYDAGDPAPLTPVAGQDEGLAGSPFGGHYQPNALGGVSHQGPVWDIVPYGDGRYVFIGNFDNVEDSDSDVEDLIAGDGAYIWAISGLAAGGPDGVDVSVTNALPQLDNDTNDGDPATGDPNGERKRLFRIGSTWYLSATDARVYSAYGLDENEDPEFFTNDGLLRFDSDWEPDRDYHPTIVDTSHSENKGLVHDAVVVLPSWRP